MTPVNTIETEKPKANGKTEKKVGKAEEISNAAQTAKVAVPASELSPYQVLETLADGLHNNVKATLMKTLGQELLEEFALESTSKIAIGRTLNRCQIELGEAFATFRRDFVEGSLRKSTATIYNYMALAEAAGYKFSAASQAAKTALFRIWAAEGCYDTANGKLKPVVDTAIKAVGGLCESKDSGEAETWARKFVDTCDKLIKGERQAAPGGRTWDAETMTEKHANVVKAYNGFITNKSVSAKKAIALLADLLVVSMVEMSAADIKAAWEIASKQVQQKKTDIKEVADTRAEAAA